MHGMFGSGPSWTAFRARAVALVSALVLSSSTAQASTRTHESREEDARHASKTDGKSCSKPSIEFVSGSESATFPLEKCDGEPIASSVDKLSGLAHSGAHKLDARLLERLELVADHFRKDGEPVKVVLVASSKARSAGSYHSSGRALDFRIDGVEDETVAGFCKTMQDTGCGFYPNAGFVHIDARDSGAGHVSWIDISHRGDAPKYVSAWPLPEPTKAEPSKEKAEKVEKVEKAEKAERAESTEKPAACEADTRDGALPALPAAAQVAPLEAPKADASKAEESDAPAAPAKKHHRRHHHHSRADHTI